MLSINTHKALIIRLLTSKKNILLPFLVSSLFSLAQVDNGNFLQDDYACMEDEPLSIIEVSILRNDTANGFTATNDYQIELDPTFLPKYGTASITKMPPNLIASFGGKKYYDTVMVKYEYTQSENKLDSLRYIVTDLTNNLTDSAFVVFDVGCVLTNDTQNIYCSPDTILPTDKDVCTASFSVKKPIINGVLDESPNYFFTYNTINSLGLGIENPIDVEVGQHDRFIAFNQTGLNKICEIYLTVQDLQKPDISCPENIVSCDPIITWDSPSAWDNCEVSSIVRVEGLPSGSQFPEGVTTISYQATDIHNQDSTCSFEVEYIKLPELSWEEGKNSDTICVNSENINLLERLDGPKNGVWSSNATNGTFIPSNFSPNTTEKISYSYAIQPCATSIDYNVKLLPPIDKNWNRIDSIFCSHTTAIDLEDYYPETSQSGAWKIGTKTTSIFDPSKESFGNHTVIYDNQNEKCPFRFSQTFTVSNPTINKLPEIRFCGRKGEIKTNTSSVDSILNMGNDIELELTNDSITIQSENYGVYNFQTINFNNFHCKSIDQYTISLLRKPNTPYAGDDILLAYDDKYFNLNAQTPNTGVGHWIYDLDSISLENDLSPTSEGTVDFPGKYQLVWYIDSQNDCPHASDTLTLIKELFVIPEAFTPNGDGINDYLVLLEDNDDSHLQLEIMNRWGQIIYSNDNYNNDWDGTLSNGKKVPTDTYYYSVVRNGSSIKGKIFIKN